jgi:predicted transcriptional regulator
MAAFTVRLPDDLTAKLDALAARLDRSRTWVATQALAEYVERETWQIAEIDAAIAEADRGEFATDEEVEAAFGRYLTKKTPDAA